MSARVAQRGRGGMPRRRDDVATGVDDDCWDGEYRRNKVLVVTENALGMTDRDVGWLVDEESSDKN